MVRIYHQDDLPDLNRFLRSVGLPRFTHLQEWIPWTDPISREKTWYKITDQWLLPRGDIRDSKAVFAIQKFPTEEGVEIRIAYYIIGKRPKAKGRWTPGGISSMVPTKRLHEPDAPTQEARKVECQIKRIGKDE